MPSDVNSFSLQSDIYESFFGIYESFYVIYESCYVIYESFYGIYERFYGIYESFSMSIPATLTQSDIHEKGIFSSGPNCVLWLLNIATLSF